MRTFVCVAAVLLAVGIGTMVIPRDATAASPTPTPTTGTVVPLPPSPELHADEVFARNTYAYLMQQTVLLEDSEASPKGDLRGMAYQEVRQMQQIKRIIYPHIVHLSADPTVAKASGQLYQAATDIQASCQQLQDTGSEVILINVRRWDAALRDLQPLYGELYPEY